MGRVLDLKSAYKPLAVHPADACFVVVAVKDPESQVVRVLQGVRPDVRDLGCGLLFLTV